MKTVLRICVVGGAALLVLIGYQRVWADSYTSTGYKLNGVIGNSTGGGTTSTNYKLESSSGESIIGNGTGGSYRLGYGYVAQLQGSMSSLALTVQPSGLISYYPMDLASTNQQVLYNGASGGASQVLSYNGSSQTTGKVSNAALLNGSSQYYSAGSGDTEYDTVTSTAGTIEFWVKASSTGTQQFLVSREAGCMGWETRINTTGTINAFIASTPSGCGSAVYTEITSPLTYADNAWHHVAVTIKRSTNTIRLYVDGQKVAESTTIPSGNGASGNALKIGADYANTNLLNGSLDEIKIYNRELTADEIRAEYDAETAGVPAGLSLGTIIGGASNSAYADVIVQSSAVNYGLAINQNNNLTSGGNTIPAISSLIASPAAWSEGSTKGLGFSLTAAPGLDSKWGAGANYAAFPNSSTTFYSRSGSGTGAKDVVTIRLRADTVTSQVSGQYNNTMTVTGTVTP